MRDIAWLSTIVHTHFYESTNCATHAAHLCGRDPHPRATGHGAGSLAGGRGPDPDRRCRRAGRDPGPRLRNQARQDGPFQPRSDGAPGRPRRAGTASVAGAGKGDGMNDPIVLLGFLPTTPFEILAFILSVATVALNIRQNHWAWLFAIVSSAAYGMVFFNSRLYGDAGLQLVFIVVSVWGWYSWLHGGSGGDRQALAVSTLDTRGWLAAGVGWAIGYLVLAWFLARYTNTDVPHTDAFLTAGSLVGQVLLSRKKLENWHAWIIVDVLYVGLYVYKGLLLTGVLYALFVAMAVAGLMAWRRSLPAGAAGVA